MTAYAVLPTMIDEDPIAEIRRYREYLSQKYPTTSELLDYLERTSVPCVQSAPSKKLTDALSPTVLTVSPNLMTK